MDTSTAPTLAVEMVEDSDEETTDSSSQDEGKAGDEEIEASLIADCGLNSSTCGYCKSKQDTSVSYGMIANRLTPQEYQDLIDLGWRRSGRYIYKPEMQATCCPAYTIRMHAIEFQPNKAQRQVQRKWDRFLAGEDVGFSVDAHPAAAGPSAGETAAVPAQQPAEASVPAADEEMADSPGNCSGVKVSGATPLPGGGTKGSTQQLEQPSWHKVQQEEQALIQALQSLITAVLQLMVSDGIVPQLPEYPAPQVLVPSEKQRRAVEGGKGSSSSSRPASASGAPTQQSSSQPSMQQRQEQQHLLFTSPVAFAVSSAARKASSMGTEQAGHTSHSSAQAADTAGRAAGHSQPSQEEARSAKKQKGSKTMTSSPTLSPQHLADQIAGHLQQMLRDPAGQPQPPHSSPAVGGSSATTSPGLADPQPQQRLSSLTVQAAGGHLNFLSTTVQALPPQPSAAPQQGAAAATGPAPVKEGSTQQEPHTAAGGSRQQRRVPRRYEVITRQSVFDEEEFALYRKYQIQHHGDSPEDMDPENYTRFLVDSPLEHEPPGPGTPGCGYGSFHQQYRVDGRLVAVGVVDVLPRCLSSVYLFWDPDWAPLALGKWTALEEIRWVQEAARTCPLLRWYYMGFYIHSCPRMKYKADYQPSDLLCPVAKVWVRMSPAIEVQLDAHRYVVLSRLPGVTTFTNLAPVGPAGPQLPPAQPAPAGAKKADSTAGKQNKQAGDQSLTGPAGGGSAQGSQQGSGGAAAGQSSSDTGGGGGGAAGVGSGPPPKAVAAEEVLVMISGNVLPWRVVKQFVLPRQYHSRIEKGLKEWLTRVGGVGAQLVYQLG